MKKEFYQNRFYFSAVVCKTRLIALLLLAVLLHNYATAQNFHLVKDINSATDGSPLNFRYNSNFYNPSIKSSFAILNGVNYFAADDGVNGWGLWRSDGTETGTWQVKDSLLASEIVVSNNKLFFVGDKEPNFWTSDGTAAGTRQVLHALPPGLSSFRPNNMTDVNGVVYFNISGHGYYDQLWKSDGTDTGTVLIKDFYDSASNNSGSEISYFIDINNKKYFTVVYRDASSQKFEKLWASDGTSKGTYIVSDSMFNLHDIFPYSANGVDTLVYFEGSASPVGENTLYTTNGVPGQVSVAPGFDVSLGYQNETIIKRSGVFYFIGYKPQNRLPLGVYKYDVNAHVVELVKEVLPATNGSGNRYSYAADLVDIGGVLFFNVYNAASNQYELWKSNGDSAGTFQLNHNLIATNFTDVNGTCFFAGSDTLGGNEIWKSDGTVAGTVRVKDILPGYNSSDPIAMTSFNGKLLFSALDGVHGRELWISDGTDLGTEILKDINQTATAAAFPDKLKALNNKFIFLAINGIGSGEKLFLTDGTYAGTNLVSDTIYNNASYGEDISLVKNNEFYFFGNTLSQRVGFYKTDGTTAGTVLIKDLTEVTYAANVNFIKATSSLVYFCFLNSTTSLYELWRTDGTAANTFVIRRDLTSYINSQIFKGVGDNFYFADGNTLWVTDGTVLGTVPIKTFTNISSAGFDALNNKLFFGASLGSGYTLWTSDGTTNGTIEVSADVTDPSQFYVANNKLFFQATGNPNVFGNVGTELFKTDGTAVGTVLVKDIHPGIESSAIVKLVSTNGKLFFFSGLPTSAEVDLWVTDGTSSGSKLLKSTIVPYYFFEGAVTAGGGKLFFVSHGKLWQSDGTVNGTDTVTDNVLTGLTISEYLANLAAFGDTLFFTGSNYAYGNELYIGSIAATLPIKLLSFTGTLNKQDGLLKWSTASERNNNYFNLQRSTNGAEFRTIARVKGAGNSQAKTEYTYTDPNITQLGKDQFYYRLQQVDQDGTPTLSNIVLIDINKKPAEYTVAPNPAKSSINLYSSATVENAQVSLVDFSGKRVYTTRKNLVAGQPLLIESAGLAAGLYVLKIETSAGVSQVKVVKQ